MPRSIKRPSPPATLVAGPSGAGKLDCVRAGGLDRPQAIALESIILGRSLQEAADAAGVDRSTLYRWRTSDPKFMKALAGWRREILGSLFDRLAGMGAAAAQAVMGAIEKGDGRLAFRMLQAMGAMHAPPPVEEIEEEPAVLFVRYMLTVQNPGSTPEEVEQFLMKRFNLSARDAGNMTYRAFPLRIPLERETADALLKEISDRGAMVWATPIKVVRAPGENFHQNESMTRQPKDPRRPGFYCDPPYSAEDLAFFEKRDARRSELEAMDEEDERREEAAQRARRASNGDGAKPSEKSPG